MNPKLKFNSDWLQKACILLAFLGLLSARDARANGLPPLITVPPLDATVQKGGTVTFTATIGVSLTPLTVEWRLNGSGNSIPHSRVSNLSIPIVGTTISTLTITNVTPALAGNYSVRVDNGGGTVTSGSALLTVLSPPPTNEVTTVSILTQGTGITNGGFQLNMLKPATSNCVIDATTDFITWTPVYTNSSGSTNVSYLDNAATNLAFRYYRVRMQ
jgi:hypothetical protein